MILSFLEWMSQLDEARIVKNIDRIKNLRNIGIPAAPTLREFLDQKQRGIRWFFIDNPASLLNAIMASDTINDVNPNDYSLFAIKDIHGNGLIGRRITHATHTIGKEKELHPDSLREVDTGIIKANNKDRYFIHLDGTTSGRKGINHDKAKDSVLEKYQKYIERTKHQVLGSQEDRQDAMMRNIIGGEEAVKEKLNQGAREQKDRMWMDLAARAEAGEDISKLAHDAGTDDVTGQYKFDNPKFITFLYKSGAGSVVDQMKIKGYIPMSDEERALVRDLPQANAAVASGQLAQIMQHAPQLKSILDNPETLYFAKAMGLKPLINHLEQGGGRLDQMVPNLPGTGKDVRTPDQAAASRSFEKMFQPQYQMQGRNVIPSNPNQNAAMTAAKGKRRPQGDEENIFVACHDPSIVHDRYWKYHTDQRRYDYYFG